MYLTTVTKKYDDIDAIKLGIASPDTIRNWSYGEVTEAKALGKNKLPDGSFRNKVYTDENGYYNGGIFCEKIFGPSRDYECMCGKYKDYRNEGHICEICGVEVTSSSVRRDRMGHIELMTPIVNWLFMRNGYISRLLSMSSDAIEKIVYYDAYVVLESKIKEITPKSVLTVNAYESLIEEYGLENITVGIGGQAIKELLARIDIENEIKEIKWDLDFITDKPKKNKLCLLKMPGIFAFTLWKLSHCLQ